MQHVGQYGVQYPSNAQRQGTGGTLAGPYGVTYAPYPLLFTPQSNASPDGTIIPLSKAQQDQLPSSAVLLNSALMYPTIAYIPCHYMPAHGVWQAASGTPSWQPQVAPAAFPLPAYALMAANMAAKTTPLTAAAAQPRNSRSSMNSSRSRPAASDVVGDSHGFLRRQERHAHRDSSSTAGSDSLCDELPELLSRFTLQQRQHTQHDQTQAAQLRGWSCMADSVLHMVSRLLCDMDIKNFRLVCRQWLAVADDSLEMLSPSSLKPKVILGRFPQLQVLQLINCPNVRNRDLFILSQGALKLRTLTIGDESNRPWVTNRGLASIARLTSLTCLSLHDCNSVTNKGLQSLNSLKSLTALSLRGCKKLTSSGLEALAHNTNLQQLDLVGCVRISDKGLVPLLRLPLVSLHIGMTRIRDEGMAHLARISSLRELHFVNEEMTEVGLRELTNLTGLESLALQDCCEMNGDALATVLAHLPCLTHLDLFRSWEFDDEQLVACLGHVSGLQSLDLRGTWVTHEGIKHLTRLSNLRSLSLSPHLEMWSDQLCVISVLTQLTSLTMNGMNGMNVSYSFLQALTTLTRLQELNLSDDTFAENPVQRQPLHDCIVDQLGAVTSLTKLDLSRRPLNCEHLATLAARLPRLRTLVASGCPIQPSDIARLAARFPHLAVVQHGRRRVDALASLMAGMAGMSNIRWTVT